MFSWTNLLGFILGQGVVHVEPIKLDLVQPQGTIDKNPENKNMVSFLLMLRSELNGSWCRKLSLCCINGENYLNSLLYF